MGSGVPSLGPIEVRRHSESHVLVELGMRFQSQLEMLVRAGSLSLGVKKLDFEGRICVLTAISEHGHILQGLELKPLLDTWPVIGAVIFYFPAMCHGKLFRAEWWPKPWLSADVWAIPFMISMSMMLWVTSKAQVGASILGHHGCTAARLRCTGATRRRRPPGTARAAQLQAAGAVVGSISAPRCL